MAVFIVMEAIIVGGYSHDLPGSSTWLGVSPWWTWEPWSRDQSLLPYVVRSAANDQQLDTKINLLLLAAATSVHYRKPGRHCMFFRDLFISIFDSFRRLS